MNKHRLVYSQKGNTLSRIKLKYFSHIFQQLKDKCTAVITGEKKSLFIQCCHLLGISDIDISSFLTIFREMYQRGATLNRLIKLHLIGTSHLKQPSFKHQCLRFLIDGDTGCFCTLLPQETFCLCANCLLTVDICDKHISPYLILLILLRVNIRLRKRFVCHVKIIPFFLYFCGRNVHSVHYFNMAHTLFPQPSNSLFQKTLF